MLKSFKLFFILSLVPIFCWSLDVSPMARPFESEAQILESYTQQSQQLDSRDLRGLFLRVYRQITIEVQSMLAHHEFQNEAWVRSLMINYANLYRESFVLSEVHPEKLPASWALAYVSSDVSHETAAFQLLTSINAHVNRDLPYALVRAGTDFQNPSLKADFKKISISFSRQMPALWKILRDYDQCDRSIAEEELGLAIVRWAMGVTRDRAWNRGEVLSQITDPARFVAEEKNLEIYSLGQFQKIKKNILTKLDSGYCRWERSH